MHWDNTRVLPVDPAQDRRRALMLWLSPDGPPAAIAKACDLAAIDMVEARQIDAGLAAIALHRPDIVVSDLALTEACDSFANRVAAQRTTETLPMLDYATQAGTGHALCRTTSVTHAFLTIRAQLRRERPCALKGMRQAGPFQLDEPGFKLRHGTACAGLSKSDLCILGPFFDVADVVFDRISLERLSFARDEKDRKSRSIDAHVSRMRRHVKAQLGVDPLRSVRGIGYALAVR
jgi:two-component system, OmpR family, phosphate regulon response regulator PhoB